MQYAVREFAKNRTPMSSIHIWLDATSIPQQNRPGQALAISSLPAYAGLCDLFVVCAPDAYHKDGNKQCNLASYSTRGWCRMELLSKVCTTGIRGTYFLSGDPNNPKLEQATREEFAKIPLKVFNAKFTCCAMKHEAPFTNCDRQQLQNVALTLYAGCVKKHQNNPDLKDVLVGMCADQDEFFPPTCIHTTKTGDETRELFGSTISIANDILGLSHEQLLGLGDKSTSTGSKTAPSTAAVSPDVEDSTAVSSNVVEL